MSFHMNSSLEAALEDDSDLDLEPHSSRPNKRLVPASRSDSELDGECVVVQRKQVSVNTSARESPIESQYPRAPDAQNSTSTGCAVSSHDPSELPAVVGKDHHPEIKDDAHLSGSSPSALGSRDSTSEDSCPVNSKAIAAGDQLYRERAGMMEEVVENEKAIKKEEALKKEEAVEKEEAVKREEAIMEDESCRLRDVNGTGTPLDRQAHATPLIDSANLRTNTCSNTPMDDVHDNAYGTRGLSQHGMSKLDMHTRLQRKRKRAQHRKSTREKQAAAHNALLSWRKAFRRNLARHPLDAPQEALSLIDKRIGCVQTKAECKEALAVGRPHAVIDAVEREVSETIEVLDLRKKLGGQRRHLRSLSLPEYA